MWQFINSLKGKVLKPSFSREARRSEYLGALLGDFKEICIKSCAIEVDCWLWIRSLELRQGQGTKLFLNGERKAFTGQINLVQSLQEKCNIIRDVSQAWDQIQCWSTVCAMPTEVSELERSYVRQYEYNTIKKHYWVRPTVSLSSYSSLSRIL